MRTYRLYIGGREVEGSGYVHSLPAEMMMTDFFGAVSLKRRLDRGAVPGPDDPVLARCDTAAREHIEAAVRAARAAAPGWGRLPLEHRLGLISRFHDRLAARTDEFIRLLTGEGHPLRFAAIEAAGIYDATAPAAVDFYREQMTSEISTPERRMLLVRKPDGVVGLNPPQNAAAINAAVGVAILAAGNTLVLRAPQSAPAGVHFLFRELVAPVLEELGAPPGTLNIVTAPSAVTLRCWIDSPLVNDIFYFGDSVRGMTLARECMANGTKAVLELAGNDGIVVWRDANPDRAASALCESFIGSGQVCLVPKFAIVHPAIAGEVISRLLAQVSEIRPALPDDPSAWLSPVMKSDRYFELLARSTGEGATVLCGGYRCDLDGTRDEAGIFIAPTVLRIAGLEAAQEMEVVCEETFFPLLPVVVLDAGLGDDGLLSSVLEMLNANRYGLRNSLWSSEERVIGRFCAELNTGGLLKINDSHVGTVAPLPAHGGTGLSGGPFGGANFPMLSTTHAQGISIGRDVDPRETVFGTLRSRILTHQF
jgi:acyl-CoA reductase-like NAD-dependent aldehyde dehydrogenase